MKLRDFAAAYEGSITMNVYAAEEDGTPIVSFPSDNYEAIKDEILDREVKGYSVKVLILYAEIKVFLAPAEIDTPVDGGEEITE